MPVSKRLTGTALLLAVLVAYANALAGPFQFDDYQVIVGNPGVHSWSAWWAGVGHGIRPLLKLSYVLDWNLGWHAPGFHLSNVLIHLGNTLLVWRLSAAFLHSTARLADRAEMLGATIALLFALHPVHTEAVTYVSGRSASLMTLFYLGGLLCYGTGRQPRRLALVVPPLCFAAALAVKEVAITFPLALVLWHLGSGGPWRSLPARTWTSWLVLGISLVFLAGNQEYSRHLMRSLEINGGWTSVLLQLQAFVYLLGQWAWPSGLNIDPDLRSLTDPSTPKLAALLVGLALSMLLCWRARQRPWLRFALGWALLHLLAIHLVAPRIDIANERQLYLASWPLIMALLAEAAVLLSRPRFVAAAVALAMCGGVLTVQRNHEYRSEVALWEATVHGSPYKSRVHNNLGYAYAQAGRLIEARRHYREAQALDPGEYKAGYNLKILDGLSGPADR